MMNLQKIVIIGAGTMGSGIAQWFAQQMCAVELVDNSQEQLEKALSSIHTSWDMLTQKNKIGMDDALRMKELLSIKSLDQVSADADLVIEAIIENLEIKKDLFKKLDQTFASHTILASNTSSFPIESSY